MNSCQKGRGGRQASRQGIPLPQPCHAACILILPRSGKGVAVQFRCPMDRHRPCDASRGVHIPPNAPTSTSVRQGTREEDGGVAVAGVAPKRRSLPSLCTAAILLFPRPPSRLPSSVGAGLRSPLRPLCSRARPPRGAPSSPPG